MYGGARFDLLAHVHDQIALLFEIRGGHIVQNLKVLQTNFPK